MNGAPAKPISGVSPSSPTSSRHGLGDVGDVVGASGRSRATSAGGVPASAITGPVPGTMSRSIPIAFSGTTMSE